MGLDLAAFRKRVGVSQQDIADATGLTQPTISRIEARTQAPTGVAMLLLNDWASAVAKRKRLPREQRLTWDHLLNSEGAAA